MRKRATETRFLPSPDSYSDWKNWARQVNIELSRQLHATSMILPFFEFILVKRLTDIAPSGGVLPWEEVIFDNTNGSWSASFASKLTVPDRAGEIKYGYGMLVFQLGVTGGAPNNFMAARVRKNGVITAPSGVVTHEITVAGLSAFQVIQPWGEVNAGDYFQLIVSLTGPAGPIITAGTDTWGMMLLSGPA